MACFDFDKTLIKLYVYTWKYSISEMGTLVDRRYTWAAAFSAEACNCVSLLEGPGVSNVIGNKTVRYLYYDAVIR